MKKLLILSSLFTLLFSGTSKLSAQSEVESQVLAIGLILAVDGYKLTHNIQYGRLRDKQSTNYYFTLNRGRNYKIYAVCDGDCGDIDLCLYDEYGNKISCDKTTDDKPLVTVRPKWTGRFRLWVNMYDCSWNPCRFGIAAFGK